MSVQQMPQPDAASVRKTVLYFDLGLGAVNVFFVAMIYFFGRMAGLPSPFDKTVTGVTPEELIKVVVLAALWAIANMVLLLGRYRASRQAEGQD